MRFIDEAKIRVSAGHGGRGCVSFRRESYAPRGGPNGGNGGKGGDVVLIAHPQLSTLQDLRFKSVYQAQNGAAGSSSHKTGRDGEDCLIELPVGTVIKEATSGEVLCDLSEKGQRWVACQGGRGGKGNAHFTTSTHQTPRFSQPGEEGGTADLLLELKLLAEVGMVGFPNAGKSTLLSRVTAAHPRVADYPFTTLVPQLGVVLFPDQSSFTLADVPGLIAGAHRGAGLGHRFLKHLERTHLLIHLMDGSFLGREDLSLNQKKDLLKEAYQSLRQELALFNPLLCEKPELLVMNKWDAVCEKQEGRKAIELFCQERKEVPLFCVSGLTGEGLSDLLKEVQKQLRILVPQAASPFVPLPDDLSIRREDKSK